MQAKQNAQTFTTFLEKRQNVIQENALEVLDEKFLSSVAFSYVEAEQEQMMQRLRLSYPKHSEQVVQYFLPIHIARNYPLSPLEYDDLFVQRLKHVLISPETTGVIIGINSN